MKTIAAITLALVELASIGRAQQPGPDAEAEAMLHAGQYGPAIEMLSQEIAANPRDARDCDKALADCSAAIKLYPNYAKAYCIMGNANWIKGSREEAANDFDEALKLDPKDASIWFDRGLFYLHKDNARTVTDMSEAIRLIPNYEQAYYDRADAYFDQQQYPEAIQDYTDAIRLNPNLGNLYHQRGFAYERSGNLDEAIADFGSAIALKPQSDLEYYTRGCAYGVVHDYGKAIADYAAAIGINPKVSAYYTQRGQAYQQLGDIDQANADLKQAAMLKGQ